ncbi:cell wall anchor protein [uncultured Duncaniella sp.]|uniref:cell wall anchor protein n=1 Tax=uncultured Duncaniella sp. TaxID=2768039 RepID=UPI0025EFD0C3|nr:cell wall anchor protein [uncultured Duncaniella sp.]
MTRHIRILFAILTLSIASATTVSAQTSLKVSLDSAYLLMGKATPLHIELITASSADGQLLVPKDTLCDKVEILKALEADTSDIHNGRIQIDQQLLLQSFDSGTYVLNPIRYVQGNETIASNRLVLKVMPVPVDTLTTIHDYADVQDVDRRFVDYLPDFLVDYGLWILALIIVLGAGYYLYRRLSRKGVETKEKVIVIPPYELAIQELDSLRSDKLCEQGREREFYTRLTDILRQYLQGRFGINAMEMTSTQIRHMLQTNEETRLSKRNMDQVLETADFVKFAKVRPLPEDNTRSFNSAIQFVEDTKPLPPAQADDDTDETPTASQATTTTPETEK